MRFLSRSRLFWFWWESGLVSCCWTLVLTGSASSPVSLLPPVFVTLTCAFRYGREDLDVLGLTFRKDLFVANSQMFPSPPDLEKSLTRLQERLMKKLGEHAHPFTFKVASHSRGTTNQRRSAGSLVPPGTSSGRSRTWIVDQKDFGGSVVEPICFSIRILSVPVPCLLRFL